jgi:molybdate transport system regulatory protein
MSKEPNIEDLKSKIRFGIKIWLEFDNKSVLGAGWAKLLENIEKNKDGSLTQAANECNYSYKYAWNILKRIEKRTGMSPVNTSRGGSGGGGYVKLNAWGKYLLKSYNEYLEEIKKAEKRLGEMMKIN